jgi:hypothetical protein
MIRRIMLSGLACLSMAIAGCAGQQGETYIAYERGQQTNTIPAPKTGEYALYAGGNETPKVVVKLNKGEKLGFEINGDGKPQAVAGAGYSTTLDTKVKDATWKLR